MDILVEADVFQYESNTNPTNYGNHEKTTQSIKRRFLIFQFSAEERV